MSARALVLGLLLCGAARAQDGERPFLHVPTTVSPEWQDLLRTYTDPALDAPVPAPDDLAGWRAEQEALEAARGAKADALVEKYRVTVEARALGGVPVLDITPEGWRDDGRVLVYAHGGAYTLLSARSTLDKSALVAARTGLRVVAVDYTLAPQAKWPEITGQVVAVVRALEEQGHRMRDIGLFGDSAGGGLAAGAVLKMRDEGLEMPAAVVLWSPWADITETGDTYTTLRHAEPRYTYAGLLGPSAAAYAAPEDQKLPWVSPVYGDYAKGFPPTLIQGGTKELFLSNFVRLYQAIDTAGQPVKLDLYEGMIHVFQAKLPDSPESRAALDKVDRFLAAHLGKRRRR